MFHHIIDAIDEDGVRYIQSTIELRLFGKGFVISKRRWEIGRSAGASDNSKRSLSIKASIHLPMLDDETQEQAEDRLIEMVCNTGAYIVGWNCDESKIVDWGAEHG